MLRRINREVVEECPRMDFIDNSSSWTTDDAIVLGKANIDLGNAQ